MSFVPTSRTRPTFPTSIGRRTCAACWDSKSPTSNPPRWPTTSSRSLAPRKGVKSAEPHERCQRLCILIRESYHPCPPRPTYTLTKQGARMQSFWQPPRPLLRHLYLQSRRCRQETTRGRRHGPVPLLWREQQIRKQSMLPVAQGSKALNQCCQMGQGIGKAAKGAHFRTTRREEG